MNSSDIRSRIIVALDLPLEEARKVLHDLVGRVTIVKIGIEAITGGWAHELAKEAQEMGFGVFWDTKFFDIPSRVEAAIAALAPVEPVMVTVHTLGSLSMMRRAKYAAAKVRLESGGVPKIFGVTLLTSMGRLDLDILGFDLNLVPAGLTPKEVVAYKAADLARLADNTGLDGVVSPASALPIIRHAFPKLQTIVPGVRPDWALTVGEDQDQITTPREAFGVGANYIVVGRPVVQAHRFGLTPVEAFDRIIKECEE